MKVITEKRQRVALRLLLLGWLALIFALSSRNQLPYPAGMSPDLLSVVGHFTVYGVLAALLWGVLPTNGWSARRRLVIAFVGAMVYALSDEWHQSFVAGREPALFDLAIDASGALCALIAISFAARVTAAAME